MYHSYINVFQTVNVQECELGSELSSLCRPVKHAAAHDYPISPATAPFCKVLPPGGGWPGTAVTLQNMCRWWEAKLLRKSVTLADMCFQACSSMPQHAHGGLLTQDMFGRK